MINNNGLELAILLKTFQVTAVINDYTLYGVTIVCFYTRFGVKRSVIYSIRFQQGLVKCFLLTHLPSSYGARDRQAGIFILILFLLCVKGAINVPLDS